MRTHGIKPEESDRRERISALTAWDGIGLYQYGLLEELRREYESDKTTSGTGRHLVCTGTEETDCQRNWSLLPSPKPDLLFSRKR